MYRDFVILCLVQCAASQMHSTQHQMYITRKTRSNSMPSESGYIYSQIGNKPPIYSSYGENYHHNSFASEPDSKTAEKLGNTEYYKDLDFVRPMMESIMPYTQNPISKHSVDYEIARAKANANYESKYLPTKIKSDIMYEKIKSAMHYQPPAGDMNEIMAGYDTINDFHTDDDDVRTSSRSSYDSWPYFYQSPYEYEHTKIDSDIDKAKDKQYSSETVRDVIPVHENIEEDVQAYVGPYGTPRYNREVPTDNPIMGDQPFLSFVLNDYFDRSNDYDPLTFKGVDWGKDFDRNTQSKDINFMSRDRRYGNKYSPDVDYVTTGSIHKADDYKSSVGESVTENGFTKGHEYDKYNKGEKQISDFKSGHDNSGKNFKGYKDFLDSFANKFGKEDHKKDSKYSLKREQDKSDKKKGFHRVYHKDEFQEDNEYYDNNKSSAKGEESGSSNAHMGGSEANLQSHAAAATGEENNSFNNAATTEGDKFENQYKGHDRSKSLDNKFNTYIDVAKKAAESNIADYVDVAKKAAESNIADYVEHGKL